VLGLGSAPASAPGRLERVIPSPTEPSGPVLPRQAPSGAPPVEPLRMRAPPPLARLRAARGRLDPSARRTRGAVRLRSLRDPSRENRCDSHLPFGVSCRRGLARSPRCGLRNPRIERFQSHLFEIIQEKWPIFAIPKTQSSEESTVRNCRRIRRLSKTFRDVPRIPYQLASKNPKIPNTPSARNRSGHAIQRFHSSDISCSLGMCERKSFAVSRGWFSRLPAIRGNMRWPAKTLALTVKSRVVGWAGVGCRRWSQLSSGAPYNEENVVAGRRGNVPGRTSGSTPRGQPGPRSLWGSTFRVVGG
jgi:hypothetical protein